MRPLHDLICRHCFSRGNSIKKIKYKTELSAKTFPSALYCIFILQIPNRDEVQKILAFKPDRLGHCTCVHRLCGGTEELWQELLHSGIPVGELKEAILGTTEMSLFSF